MSRTFNTEGRSQNAKSSRCSHRHCSDCKTRRGDNRSNRRERYIARVELLQVLKTVTVVAR